MQRAFVCGPEKVADRAGTHNPDAPIRTSVEDYAFDLPSDYTNEYDTYWAVFSDFPMQEAASVMFEECAVPYDHVAGSFTTNQLSPMTLDEAGDIIKHGEEFVLRYSTSTLGSCNTSKVLYLFRQILHSISMHGKLTNGKTSVSNRER